MPGFPPSIPDPVDIARPTGILSERDQAGVRREYSSYCGNYTFDGTRLVTRVDAASDPSRIDSDQVQYTPQGRLPTGTDFPRS